MNASVVNDNTSGANRAQGTMAALTTHGLGTPNGVTGTDGDESLDFSSVIGNSTESIIRLPKTTYLRESTLRNSALVKTQLGDSFDTVFDSNRTFEDFLEALTTERLRHMPHKGSKWDNVLRWAEIFAAQVFDFHEAVRGFMLHSDNAAQLIWASCISLLQVSLVACPVFDALSVDGEVRSDLVKSVSLRRPSESFVDLA